MDSVMSEPLAVVKSDFSYQRRVSSMSTTSIPTSSYPRIPRRHSSLCASVNHDSNGPTSTRTPSLSDSLYRIEVMKIRLPTAGSHPNAFRDGLDEIRDPFLDRGFKSNGEDQETSARSRHRMARRLLVRWSSGSWNSLEPCLADPTMASIKTHLSEARVPRKPFGTTSVQSLSNNSGQMSPEYLRPIDLPISFINMKSAANIPSIGRDPVSVWATVHMSADISPIAIAETANLAPLDLIILLDSLPQSSVDLQSWMILGPSTLASNLVTYHDRIALAYVDTNEAAGFQLLLPLAFHSVEVTQSVLESFYVRRLVNTNRSESNLGCVIRGVAQLFCRSPRAAFCHLVFVSVAPLQQLSVPGIDAAIGFHTISPRHCFPLETTSHPTGWHIVHNARLDDSHPEELRFMRKVSKMTRQLRTGLSPGAISDLKLCLVPGLGCQVQSVMQVCHLKCLRPGESWIVPVQISVPAASRRAAFHSEYSSLMHSHHPILDSLIREIDDVLNEYSIKDMDQHVLTARLEYKHSLLPAASTIHLESHCTVSRIGSPAPGTSWDFEEASIATTDVQDDASGVSLGSMTESI